MRSLIRLIFILQITFPFTCFGQTGADTAAVNNYLKKGRDFVLKSAYDSSNYYYTEAEKISKAIRYQRGWVTSVFGFGLIKHYQRDYQEALAFYLQALELWDDSLGHVDPIVTKLHNNIGGVYIDMGYRLKARKYLERAIELDKKLYPEPSIAAATTHYNFGLLNMYFGENKTALHHFLEAYQPYLETYGENGARVAQLYTNVGLLYHNSGDLEHAEDYFNRAITIHLENHGETYWNLAYPYLSLGEMQLKKGDKKSALTYYLKVLNLCRNNRKQLIRVEGIVNGALATYYLDEEDYTSGMTHARAAIDIISEAYYDQHPKLNDFYQIIGRIHMKQGDYQVANQWFDKARDVTINAYGAIHPKISSVHLKQSDIYLKNQNHAKALSSVQAAIATLSPSFDSSDPSDNPALNEVLDEKFYSQLLTHKGAIFQELAGIKDPVENLEKALMQYRIATLIIDHIRRGYLSENSKLFLQENTAKVYEKALSICYRLYNLTKSDEYLNSAFFFFEKSKASVLSEAIQTSDLNRIKGVDQAVLEKEVTLGRHVKSLELKLADTRVEDNDSVQYQLKKDLFHAKARMDSLENVIRSHFPDYHALKYNMAVTTADSVQAGLDEDSLVISFFEGDSTWYMMSLAKHNFSLNQVSKSLLSVEELESFRAVLSDFRSLPSEYYPGARMIYETLLQPVLQKHTGVQRLIIVPDGILNYIPFDALISKPVDVGETFRSPSYLIRDYAISYRNSLTLYAQHNRPERKYEKRYVGFAPSYLSNSLTYHGELASRQELSPLMGTREEVSVAGDIFEGIKFLDKKATEYNFKNLPYSASILHLAMHALVDDKEPMRSRLIFTNETDTIEDGNLNAYEIYHLPLESELAVLSACNTGLGKINRGEGVLSLSRAFMYAGCANIVMSMWRAQDQSTSQIMGKLFQNLENGLHKDKALRQAKLYYLQQADPLQSHPAHWATFMLFGDQQPLSGKSDNSYFWVLGLIAGLVVSATYLYKRKHH